MIYWDIMIQFALYVHIPFCRRRCSYCDFNTWAGLDHLMRPYIQDGLQREIDVLSQRLTFLAQSVYFGGGTPSLMPASLLSSVLKAVPLADGAEVSLEVNPGTMDRMLLGDLKQIGVNRLSIGMQSAVDAELRMLGRDHDLRAVAETVDWARRAGLGNISLDLIYGLPGQKASSWERTLTAALSLEPDHLSVYALSVEPGTPLEQAISHHRLPAPDPDLAADMYELATDQLHAAGYLQYELSNWSVPGMECHHNLAYWRNHVYLGIGAGASGHWPVGDVSWRLHNEPDPRVYLDLLASRGFEQQSEAGLPAVALPACLECEHIPRTMSMAETMFMGLRLVREGVSRAAFKERFDADVLDVFGEQMDDLSRAGLIDWDETRVWLQPSSYLVSNLVFSALLPG